MFLFLFGFIHVVYKSKARISQSNVGPCQFGSWLLSEASMKMSVIFQGVLQNKCNFFSNLFQGQASLCKKTFVMVLGKRVNNKSQMYSDFKALKKIF